MIVNSLSVRKSRCARYVCAALVASLCWSAPAYTQPVGIPSMGSASSSELSPALERTLGDAIMEQGRRDPTYIADPDVSQYLTSLGRTLASNAPTGIDQPIHVFGVRDAQINAFALPGGYIGINSGLVVTAETESELASVIAHEIGHVAQRHIARGMTQKSQSSGVMMAALAGALLAALSGSGDLAMGVAAFGQAAAVDRQLGFSRQAEQEADRTGFEMMRKAGFDPRGMARMFNHLSSASRLNEGAGGGGYTSTHPLSIQRLSDIENRIRETPSTKHQDSSSFWYIRAKLRVLQAKTTQAQRQATDRLQLDVRQKTGVEQAAAWYGLSYAALARGDKEGAARALAEARKLGANSPEVAGLAVSVALAQGDSKQALELATAGGKRWPDSLGIALVTAEAYQKAGQDREAVTYLDGAIGRWSDVPRFYQLKAQSQERLGQQVNARRSMATYYDLTGALPTAVELLQQARNMSKDFYTQSELDVQIRTLRDRIKADRELLERFRKS